MFRKPLFWIAAVILASGCILFTWYYFPKAFPVVTVDIAMDRQMAMEQADEIAQRFSLGPDDYRIAASYSLNSHVQNYVELEAGGADAFRDLLESGLYSPYTWQVRLFRELETNEALVRFTPKGEPWGFTETLSEDEPGAVVSADSARNIAEEAASDFWAVNLEAYHFVESSENMRPGGRLDHTFVYERLGEKIGEAEYRLRLGVSGDRLTELTHFVRIPEAFDRRYEELRSANNSLASAATIAVILLFGLAGCGFGLFYLLKQRYVIWKQPVLVSSIIAFLVMLTMLNSWPLQWMDYDTALSYQNHIMMQISVALLAFIGMAILFSIIFMAAESLTRKAFPNHIQFWKLWSSGAASSKQVLGLTSAAFLLVCFELSYVTGTYYLSSNFLGWWYPSSALYNPDVIAEYFPWLTALAISLQAAFWEEALFRAIPIAGAVLIGKKYGKTILWVIAAFALQALLFGAVHADYPQLPFYARTVELILPSIIFGLVFYFAGLYPAILIHFWYNFVWFSLSVFAAATPGMIWNQLILIVIGLLPFWIILFQWIRVRALGEVPEEALNSAWEPVEQAGAETQQAEPETEPYENPVFTPTFFKAAAVAGIAGLTVWIFLTDFSKDAPPVEINRTEAIEIAENELNSLGIELDDHWQAFSRVYGGTNMQHRFVWKEGGEEVYHELLGSYLILPSWMVRYATFEGEVEERAEEFRMYITRKDSLEEFRHVLPEHRPGAGLDENEARSIADHAISENIRIDPEQLRFVSAESSSLPERTDWTIIYADTLSYPLDKGEARILVQIAGDEVTRMNRFIHVPEEWDRQYRDSRTIPDLLETSSQILVILLFLAGMVAAVIRWSKGRFGAQAFLVITGGMLLLMAMRIYNVWPLTETGFSTAQAYSSQALTSIGFTSVIFVISALASGLLGGFIHRWKIPVSGQLIQSPGKLLSVSLFPVLFIVGLFALVSGFSPQSVPDWGNAGIAGAAIPWLAGMLDPVSGYVNNVLLLILIFGSVHHFTNGWQNRRLLFGILLIFVGFVTAGSSVESLTGWILEGLISGVLMILFYKLILRHHMPLVILLAAFYTILDNVGSLLTPMYAGDGIAWILGSLLIASVSWIWHRQLSRQLFTKRKTA
jgi:hypothetical protein